MTETSSPSSSPPMLPQCKRPMKHSTLVCIGIVTILLIISIVIIVLIFTFFKPKDPFITLNHIFLSDNTTASVTSGANITLTADVSVKNPNPESFKFSNTSTSMYYRGVMIGTANGPPGEARARRTFRMYVTMAVVTKKILAVPELTSDLSSGLLTFGSFTSVPGRVRIIRIIRKHVVVRMNCTIVFNISSQGIQDQKCRRHVHF